jgi:hypothetical protein
LKLLRDETKKNEIVSLIATLLQDLAGMIYCPDDLVLDAVTLGALTQHHRGAADAVNKIDAIAANELYGLHRERITRDGTTHAPQDER